MRFRRSSSRFVTEEVARRLEAVNLLAQGLKQAEVARRLGVTREAVRKWRAAYVSGGPDALTLPKPRKTPRVVRSELAQLLSEAVRNAARLGLPAQWTAAHFATLIEERFGVAYAVPHVHRILIALGYRFERGRGWQPRPLPRQRRGEPPWGFQYDSSGQLVRNEREHRIQCVVRGMYVDGESIKAIVHFLKGKGLDRDGRPLGSARVRQMLFGSQTHSGGDILLIPEKAKKTGRTGMAKRAPLALEKVPSGLADHPSGREPAVKRSSTRIRARSLPAVISRLIESALEGAEYVRQEDGSYGATVPGLRGVVANGETVEQCRARLGEVIESWRKLVEGLRRHDAHSPEPVTPHECPMHSRRGPAV